MVEVMTCIYKKPFFIMCILVFASPSKEVGTQNQSTKVGPAFQKAFFFMHGVCIFVQLHILLIQSYRLKFMKKEKQPKHKKNIHSQILLKHSFTFKKSSQMLPQKSFASTSHFIAVKSTYCLYLINYNIGTVSALISMTLDH